MIIDRNKITRLASIMGAEYLRLERGGEGASWLYNFRCTEGNVVFNFFIPEAALDKLIKQIEQNDVELERLFRDIC